MTTAAKRLPARLLGLAAVAGGTALVAAQAARLRAWIVDDAAVTFAYARSLAHGLGPVQQPGAAPVEGYSNPSWLLLLTLGHGLGLFDRGSLLGVPDLVWYPKLLALMCVAATLGCVLAASRSAGATLLAGAALAIDWSYVAWSFSGLENALYGLLAAALGALLARAAAAGRTAATRTAVLAGLLALLAALTRPDGVIYALAHPVVLLLFSGAALRRSPLRALVPALLSLAVFGLPYLGFLLWRRAEFGQWLPNTAVAKSQGTPGLADLDRTGALLTYVGWTAVLVAAVAAGVVLTHRGAARRGLLAATVPLGLALLAFAVLRPDWMALNRFATPVWTSGALVGALALRGAWELAGRRVWRVGMLGAVLVALLLSAGAQAASASDFRRAPTLSMCRVADRFGLVFNDYADRLGLRAHGAALLLPDLGGTLLTTRLRVVDLAGLTDPVIARAYADDDMARLRAYVLGEVRPTFVHVQGPWASMPGLTPERLRAAGYVPLYRTEDWVRADAVGSPDRLNATRAWAAKEIPAVDAYWDRRPLARCVLPRP